mgnify:CR=1 FL=1
MPTKEQIQAAQTRLQPALSLEDIREKVTRLMSATKARARDHLEVVTYIKSCIEEVRSALASIQEPINFHSAQRYTGVPLFDIENDMYFLHDGRIKIINAKDNIEVSPETIAKKYGAEKFVKVLCAILDKSAVEVETVNASNTAALKIKRDREEKANSARPADHAKPSE